MPNSPDIKDKLVPIGVQINPVSAIASLAPSQDTTSDQLSAFYRPSPIPFVRHSPLPVAGQSNFGAASKSVSQTQSGRTVYGVSRNLSQIANSTVNQGLSPTVTSNNQTVTKVLRNLPTAFTLTGSWTNPQNAIDNSTDTFATASSTSANIVYLATTFGSFSSWFTSNLLQVITQVTAVSGGSVIVEYSINSGTSWTNMRTVSAADTAPVTTQVSLPLTLPTNNVQVRITLPGSSTGNAAMATANAGTAANDASFGTSPWTNPSSAVGQQTIAFANVNFSSSTVASTTTERLKLTNFGFAVPVGATINGIAASVYEAGLSSTGIDRFGNPHNRFVFDAGIFLYKAGAVTGSDHSSADNWPNSPAPVSYGSNSDLWGAAWTPADINNAGFGIAICAELDIETSSFFSTFAKVYYVALTVYYTTAAGSASATTRIYDIAQLTTLQ